MAAAVETDAQVCFWVSNGPNEPRRLTLKKQAKISRFSPRPVSWWETPGALCAPRLSNSQLGGRQEADERTTRQPAGDWESDCGGVIRVCSV